MVYVTIVVFSVLPFLRRASTFWAKAKSEIASQQRLVTSCGRCGMLLCSPLFAVVKVWLDDEVPAAGQLGMASDCIKHERGNN